MARGLALPMVVLAASSCGTGAADDELVASELGGYALVTAPPGLSFFRPLVESPTIDGVFDASRLADLSVDLVRTDGAGAFTVPVAAWDARSTPALLVFSKFERYQVLVRLGDHFTVRGSTYRFRVLFRGVVLATADMPSAVFDYVDRSPNLVLAFAFRLTPPALDRDGDGVLDLDDHCPDRADPANPVPTAETCNGLDDDCDGVVDDGASAACPGFANGAAACVEGRCELVGCSVGFADCDHQADDGCEVSTRTDARNCGACGNSCAPGVPCEAGACAGVLSTGLLLELDAERADGTRAYASGCPSASLVWRDATATHEDAVLQNFASCGATSGWNGAGTADDPRRLTLDGANDFLLTAANDLLDGQQSGTLSLWIRAAANTDCLFASYSSRSNGSTNMAWSFDSAGRIHQEWNFGHPSNFDGAWASFDTAPAGVNDGGWHHLSFVADGVGATRIFVDGQERATTFVATTSPSRGSASINDWLADVRLVTSYAHHITIGGFYRTNLVGVCRGDLAWFAVYGRALTREENARNCNALRARFPGARCL